jgi:hypothetical protein
MPESRTNEEVVRAYAAMSAAADLDGLARLRHADWSVTWPQSGERVMTQAAFGEIVRNYPGGAPRTIATRIVGSEDRWVVTPGNTVIRVVGSGGAWWCEWRTTYPDGVTYLCVDLLELLDGLIHRETVYWAPVFDAPAWRAPWVERADDAAGT